MAVRVLLVSEVRLYREGLQQVLQQGEGIELAGVAAVPTKPSNWLASSCPR